MKFYFRSMFIFLVAFAIGCAGGRFPRSGIIERLKNRGPVPLSSDNPYLAGNILLAKEMEHSSEVKGFVEHRGTPGAIEISQELFSEPAMRFYYPENGEFYSFEYVDDTWLIEGPLSISAEKQRELKRSTSGGAKIVLPTPSVVASQTSAAAASLSGTPQQNLKPFKSPPIETAVTPVVPAIAVPTPDISQIKALIDKAPKNDAEISPKGDLVHYVTFPGETLSMIAKWYTFDESNTGRLARLNKLKEGETLSPGDTIIVPSYFVRNKVRLNQEAISGLQENTRKDLGTSPTELPTPIPTLQSRRY